jgi:predicted membrane-bound spermidine synthase
MGDVLETAGQHLKQIRWAASICAAALFIFTASTFDTNKPLVASHPIFAGNRIQYYKDTNSGSLSVLEVVEEVGLWGRNVKFLNINGNNTAQTTFADIIVHKLLAHVPMLLHPSPKDVLVVGFGFGSTSRSVLAYEVDRVDCVELIGEERETAKFFLPENHAVLEHPRFHFIVNDGRNYLLATPKQYDVISFNAIDPKMSPALYTRTSMSFAGRGSKKMESLPPGCLSTDWSREKICRSFGVLSKCSRTPRCGIAIRNTMCSWVVLRHCLSN